MHSRLADRVYLLPYRRQYPLTNGIDLLPYRRRRISSLPTASICSPTDGVGFVDQPSTEDRVEAMRTLPRGLTLEEDEERLMRLAIRESAAESQRGIIDVSSYHARLKKLFFSCSVFHLYFIVLSLFWSLRV